MIYTQYARVITSNDIISGDEVLKLYSYTTFIKYERWKEKGRSHDGKRRKCKLVVYDFSLKKIKTKIWTI